MEEQVEAAGLWSKTNYTGRRYIFDGTQLFYLADKDATKTKDWKFMLKIIY